MLHEPCTVFAWLMALGITAPLDPMILKFMFIPFVAVLELMIFPIAVPKGADVRFKVTQDMVSIFNRLGKLNRDQETDELDSLPGIVALYSAYYEAVRTKKWPVIFRAFGTRWYIKLLVAGP